MNKKLAVCLLAALVGGLPASRLSAQLNANRAPGGPLGPVAGNLAIKNINVATPKTPEFTTIGSETQAKRYVLGQWLEVEVEFASAVPAKELNFHYSLLVAGTLLVGDVTHVDILPGQSLFSVVYVAPRTLLTLLRGAPLTINSVQNVDVQILRPGVSAPLADKMLHPGPAFYTTMQQVPNLVRNKSETPFAFLWWDRYEAIKQNNGPAQ